MVSPLPRKVGSFMRHQKRSQIVFAIVLLQLIPNAPLAQADWAASWSAAPARVAVPGFQSQTVRQFLRLSLGGSQLRVRFSNETGSAALVIGAAHVALPGSAPGSIDPTSDQVLTFSGQSTAIVPPGAPIVSDPVTFPVASLSTIAISAVFTSSVAVGHAIGGATAYLAAGNHVADPTMPGATTSTSRFYLDGVELGFTGPAVASIGTIGDSITDGFGSTLDGNRRWTDRLAERLAARIGGPPLAVLNGGIAGNALLTGQLGDVTGSSALARLDRDVLARPGVRWLVVFEGINDIGFAAPDVLTANDLIVAYRQIIARAHDRGIKVLGATLSPFLGSGAGYYTVAKDRVRQAVNRWILNSGEFDGALDFDAVLRDPARPVALLPAYDSGDHLHPNDAGYRAMGDAIPLDAFR